MAIRFLLIGLAISLLFAPAAFAADPPVPKSKTEALKAFRSRLAAEEQQTKALARKVEELDGNINDTRTSLVDIAQAIRKNETELRDLETRIERLEEKKLEAEQRLQKDRGSISRLIVAMERIRRVPPEAMLARPETPYKNAQSAMLMRNIIPAINRHAETLRVNLETLDNITAELQKERNASLKSAENLSQRHEEMSALLDKRESLYRDMNKDLKAREARIESVSLQAKNLEDLVQRLKEEEKKEKERAVAAPDFDSARLQAVVTLEKPQVPRASLFSLRKPQPDAGKPQLPISGIIRTRYRELDDLNARSNGLTIEGRPGSPVVAPMGGTIQFAGPFKRYGNLIIIEHAQGYHSLVAGLGKIDTVVGQTVAAGEPLGTMPNSALAVRPKLYYELRRNGQPVNPATRFSDLG